MNFVRDSDRWVRVAAVKPGVEVIRADRPACQLCRQNYELEACRASIFPRHGASRSSIFLDVMTPVLRARPP